MNMSLLLEESKVRAISSKPEYDIIDEYESSEVESKPFPLTYHVDHDEQKIFLICIEASYQNDSN